MADDPLTGWGLRSVELNDRAIFQSHFASLARPLSDYTFSQLYTWRNSLRILWKMIRGHLCVFANGTGDLTLLMPPIGDTGSDAALAEAFEMMDLAGGELASKRQAKNRFMRNHDFRVESYRAENHRFGCTVLLDQWKIHQDAQHLEESDSNSVKRAKESIAAALCLDTAEELGLKGMVVYADERRGTEDICMPPDAEPPARIRGFT